MIMLCDRNADGVGSLETVALCNMHCKRYWISSFLLISASALSGPQFLALKQFSAEVLPNSRSDSDLLVLFSLTFPLSSRAVA